MPASRTGLGVSGIALLLGASFTSPIAAAESVCDPSLKQILDNPHGYRMRGDRCEGIYVKDVGATVLLVASFTQAFENYDASAGRPLQIEWTDLPASQGLRVRALSLKRRLYYRMDVARPSGSRNYSWSTEILAAQQLRRPEIGVVGVSRHVMGGKERNIHLPLRIKQRASGDSPGPYQLVLMPGAELAEVYITLAPVTADGHSQTPLKDGQALGYGYYPAERAIEVSIPAPERPGIYDLRIGATLKVGGSATAELTFYHAGK